MSGWRKDFTDALEILASVSAAMDRLGLDPPILVGGGAVELYTQSQIATGDFDLVTGRHEALNRILCDHGFDKPSGPGEMTRGWIHPQLAMGFEVVGSALLDGNADRDYIRLIHVGDAGEIAVISPEDIIADRMGQFASGTADEMRAQAVALFKVCKDLDRHYMEQRIRTETDGRYGISDLEAEASGHDAG